MQPFSIVIHGGAGTILKSDMTPELEEAYMLALEEALNAGYAVLEQGGTSTNAVKAAIVVLEDNVLFNAGRGSVFTKKGLQEIKLEPDEYFFSQFRYDQWKEMRDSDNYSLDHTHSGLEELMKDKKFGTVGAAACDMNGNIAAATSTGGMTNKKYGRIGDSPIIGAGTYANNKTCAISCTGHGEPFIRAVAAHSVSCLMEYKGLSLPEAMNEIVNEKLVDMEGEGGMIGVDAQGNTAMIFNSAGMYRAMKNSEGELVIGIYKD
jgi:beta-aspartyl-peptidase (threonine type)